MLWKLLLIENERICDYLFNYIIGDLKSTIKLIYLILLLEGYFSQSCQQRLLKLIKLAQIIEIRKLVQRSYWLACWKPPLNQKTYHLLYWSIIWIWIVECKLIMTTYNTTAKSIESEIFGTKIRMIIIL